VLAFSPHAGRRKRLGALLALVLPVVDQIVDHGGIRQGRGVAEIAELVLGDLAQDAAHDFSRTRLRQARRELDEIGRRDRADLGAHPLHQFLAQRLGRLFAGHQGDIGVDAVAFDVVRIADDAPLITLQTSSIQIVEIDE